MSWDKSHAIVAVVSGATVAFIQWLSFGATYGRLTQSVEDLSKRVEVLEQKTMPGTKLGDLCIKMMDAQSLAYRTHDSQTADRIDDQLKRLRCYSGVPAAATVEANSAVMPPEGR